DAEAGERRHAFAAPGVAGEEVGLAVVGELERVLDPAEQAVGAEEGVGLGGLEEPGEGEPGERRLRVRSAELGELAAPGELERLDGELDLADPAAPELHVEAVLAA